MFKKFIYLNLILFLSVGKMILGADANGRMPCIPAGAIVGAVGFAIGSGLGHVSKDPCAIIPHRGSDLLSEDVCYRAYRLVMLAPHSFVAGVGIVSACAKYKPGLAFAAGYASGFVTASNS